MNMESQSRGVCFRKLFDRKSTKGNLPCMSWSIYLTSLSSQICSTQSLAKLNRVYYLRKRWKKNIFLTLWASLKAFHPSLVTWTKQARKDSGCLMNWKPFSGLWFSNEKSFSPATSISCPIRAMENGAGVRNCAQFMLEDIINKAVSFLSSPELAFIIALLRSATTFAFGSAAIFLWQHNLQTSEMRTAQSLTG